MNEELAIRPPVLEGTIVNTELEELVRRYGLFDGIGQYALRRITRAIEAEFITGNFPEGADPTLPIIEVQL